MEDLTGVWRRRDIPPGAGGIRLIIDPGGNFVFAVCPGGRMGWFYREFFSDRYGRVR